MRAAGTRSRCPTRARAARRRSRPARARAPAAPSTETVAVPSRITKNSEPRLHCSITCSPAAASRTRACAGDPRRLVRLEPGEQRQRAQRRHVGLGQARPGADDRRMALALGLARARARRSRGRRAPARRRPRCSGGSARTAAARSVRAAAWSRPGRCRSAPARPRSPRCPRRRGRAGGSRRRRATGAPSAPASRSPRRAGPRRRRARACAGSPSRKASSPK